jgi:hypothetical protein
VIASKSARSEIGFAVSADYSQAFIPHCSTAKLWTLIALRLARIRKHLASVFVDVL